TANAYVSGYGCGTAVNYTSSGSTVPVVVRRTPGGTLTFIAGRYLGSTADRIAATQAHLADAPSLFRRVSDGMLFLTLSVPNKVRTIDGLGNINTFAGTGTFGFNGDYIPAGTAQLYYPRQTAELPGGHIAILDQYNHSVRIVW